MVCICAKEGQETDLTLGNEGVKTWGFGFFTSDFYLTQKGWVLDFIIPFGFGGIYKKNGKSLILVRTKKWKKEREKYILDIHGFKTIEELEIDMKKKPELYVTRLVRVTN